MEWIPFGIRSRVIRFLLPPGKIDMNFDVNFFGLRYFGNISNYIDWCVYFYGAYSKTELIFIGKILNQLKESDLVVLDVGANVGHHTLFFSKFASFVHSFEPCREIYEKACYNVSKNNLQNIKIYPVALGSDTEIKQFFVSPSSNLGQGSLINKFNQNEDTAQSVEVFNGDEFLQRQKIQRVDFIKIDVEGFEKSVLVGLRQALVKFRPIIFMEFSHETRVSFGSYEKLCKVIPDDYVIKSVSFSSFKKRLVDFKFDTNAINILLLPSDSKLNLDL